MRQHETLCFPRDRLLTSWYRLTCQCRLRASWLPWLDMFQAWTGPPREPAYRGQQRTDWVRQIAMFPMFPMSRATADHCGERSADAASCREAGAASAP